MKFYHYFPLNWLGLKATGENMQRSASRPLRVDGTRWIAFIHNAVSLFLKQWDVLVMHLQQANENPSRGRPDIKAPKAAGILKMMLAPNVLFTAAFVFDVLSVLKPLSEVFQSSNSSPFIQNREIHQCLKKLNKLSTRGFPTAISMKERMQQEGQLIMYKGERLQFQAGRNKDGVSSTVDKFYNKQQAWANKVVSDVVEQIKKRFSTAANRIISSTKIFSMECFPFLNDELVADYGDAEVQAAVNHFETLLQAKGCDLLAVHHEWQSAKALINDNP
jgi:hypothetical protein